MESGRNSNSTSRAKGTEEILASTSSVKPILSLEFQEDKEELIAGGVGNIRIYTFRRGMEAGSMAYHFKSPRLVIADLAIDEWVTHTYTFPSGNKIYAACENHVFIYDYTTGKRLESLRDIHELSISAMTFYEPFQYLITGSRDSSSMYTLLMLRHYRHTKLVEYDGYDERLLVLGTTGTIAMYDSRRNPCQVKEEWTFAGGHERITCMTALKMLSNRPSTPGIDIDDIETETLNGPFSALLAGTDLGQISLIDINVPGGYQSIMIQAHSGEVLSISFYPELKRLITASADGTVKLWTLSVSDSKESQITPVDDGSAAFASTTSVMPYSITPAASISASTIHIPNDLIATTFSYNTKTHVLAVGTNKHHIMMFKCNKEGMLEGLMRKHPTDEDHTKPITKIVCLETLGIFASSSEDGTVKIWDGSDNSLIREIQFNEPLRTLCFCNNRGDLLVGLADQVALVRIPDYMPLNLLTEILSNPRGWPDDLIESTKHFDSAFDFWEVYRDDLERQGVDMSQWHVSIKKPVDNTDYELLRRIEELDRRRAQAAAERRKRKKKKELEEKKNRHLRVDRIVGANQTDQPTHRESVKGKRGALDELRGRMAEDSDDDDDSDSEDDGENAGKEVIRGSRRQREVGVADLAFNNKKQDEEVHHGRETSHAHHADHQNSGPERHAFHPPVIHENGPVHIGRKTFQELAMERGGTVHLRLEKPQMTPAQISAYRREQMRSVQPPPPPKKKENKVSSSWVQTIAKLGMLPNSVVSAEVGEEKKRRQTLLDRQQRERRELEKAEEDRKEAQKLAPNGRPKFLMSRREKPPVVEDDETLDMVGIKEDIAYVELQDDIDDIDDEQAERDAALAKEKAAAEEAERQRKLREKEEAAKLAEKQRLEAEEEERRRKEAEEAERFSKESSHAIKDESTPTLPPATPPRDPTPPPPPKADTKPKKIRKESKTPAPKPKPKKEEPVVLPPVEKVTVIKINPIIPPRVPTPPSRPKTPIQLPPATPPPVPVVQPSLEPAAEDDTDEDSETDFKLVDVIHTENDATAKKQEAIQAWNLFGEAFKQASNEDLAEETTPTMPKIKNSSEDVRPEFSKIINNFWFPGLNGKPVNLMNIVEVLLKLMRHGLWNEKCEASKALLYLYRTFERDFGDPFEKLIIPQLELTSDESWQFRAQCCTNLAGYGIYHPDIVYALICRLSDKVDIVRRAARKSLTHMGIDSKNSLKAAMIQLKMIPADTFKTSSSWLDYLLGRIQSQTQTEIGQRKELVETWRRKVDPSIQGQQFVRPASCLVTLVRPGEDDLREMPAKPPTAPQLTSSPSPQMNIEDSTWGAWDTVSAYSTTLSMSKMFKANQSNVKSRNVSVITTDSTGLQRSKLNTRAESRSVISAMGRVAMRSSSIISHRQQQFSAFSTTSTSNAATASRPGTVSHLKKPGTAQVVSHTTTGRISEVVSRVSSPPDFQSSVYISKGNPGGLVGLLSAGKRSMMKPVTPRSIRTPTSDASRTPPRFGSAVRASVAGSVITGDGMLPAVVTVALDDVQGLHVAAWSDTSSAI
ncbi:hypothetical protein HDV05_006846 [Chytridiales sp. JEL 0842]|nr:hypothetical protein HDV05_006846 [Chytridiales sp. JEL 0842]